MNELIRKALDAAGYDHQEATEENLRDCFEDYVVAGVWHDVDREDIDDLTIEEMANGLIACP